MTDAPETDASFLAPVSGTGFWSVCQGYNVRAPYQAVQIFGNISTALGTLAIH